MAIEVVSVSEAADVWRERAAAAAARYQAKAGQAGQRWEAGATRAAPNFRAAVTASDIERRYAGGVRKAGAGRYQQGVQEKGASRFPQGVQVSADRYSEAISPYLQTLQGLTLPQRKPRGDPGNIERVRLIAQALHQRRLQLIGAGRST